MAAPLAICTKSPEPARREYFEEEIEEHQLQFGLFL